MKKYILTFELRYTIHKEEESDHASRKYTLGEFAEFKDAVLTGNEFVKSLNLDHSTTPGINGDRLGTPIIGTVKNSLIRNYIRNNNGQRIAEVYIKISTVNCVDLEEALKLCHKIKSVDKLTTDPLNAN